MVKVVKKKEPVKDIYGLRDPAVKFFSSGCTLLDCVLGGGWALSRVINIVGSYSSGKSLLAIEACANFRKSNPKGKIVYIETEAAFDHVYAESLGLPSQGIDFPPIFTVEDAFEDLEGRLKSTQRTLVVIDSLDALSDRAEQERAIDKESYGAEKSKMISQWFRRQNQRLSRSSVTVIIVSQLRDAIGVKYGEKQKRSGGKALDYYATQVLWLSQVKTHRRTIKGVERATGVQIRARCKKNKVGPPFRQCEFPLLFNYGVEDVQAGLDWLVEVKRTDAVGMTQEAAKKLAKKLDRLTPKQYQEERQNIGDAVKEVWNELEQAFTPNRKKYNS